MPATTSNPNLESLYKPLWLTYGLVPLLAGLDKFFNLLADWPKYVSPLVAGLLPVSAQTFMYAVGIIEIAPPSTGRRWWNEPAGAPSARRSTLRR